MATNTGGTAGVLPSQGTGGMTVFVTEAQAAAGRPPEELTAEDSCGAVKAETQPVEVEKEIITEEPAPVAILFVLDNSASMADITMAGPTTGDAGAPMNVTRWQQAIDAITGFVNDPASAGLSVALEYFAKADEPDNDNTPDECPEDSPGSVSAEMGPLPDNATTITTSLAAHGPDKFHTHTVTALQRGTNYCIDHQAANPEVQCVVVLITDGLPTSECGLSDACDGTAMRGCLDPEAEGYLTPIATGALDAGVSTFTVGMDGVTPEGFGLLDSIAIAGGTDCTPGTPGEEACNVATSGTAGFIAALEAIRNTISRTETVTETVVEALPCEWQVPPPTEGEELDLEQVNLSLALDGQPAAFVSAVEKLDDCALAPNGDGWHYDETKTKIVACPTTCDVITASSDTVVQILLGCKTEKFIK